jgi:glycosyltransferase involved in cell wall biosynthesis
MEINSIRKDLRLRIALVIYGDIRQTSGGYLYDRLLVEHLVSRGDSVEIISLPKRSYIPGLLRGLFRRSLQTDADIILLDELCHPDLFRLKPLREADGGGPRGTAEGYNSRCPAFLAIVHHLRSSEKHPIYLLPLYRYIEDRFLRSVAGFVFNSPATMRETFRLLRQDRRLGEGKRPAGREPPLPVCVVATPGGDRWDTLTGEAGIRKKAFREGGLRILFVGNIIPRKGLQTLLAALRDLPRTERSWSLTVAGSPRAAPFYAARAERLAESLGPGRVVFEGEVDDRRLLELYRESDVLAMPSEYEGFGIVYLEAMRFGIVPVASSAGGAAEIVEPGRSGFLVPPGDLAGLSRALECLLNDREALARLGIAAMRRAAEFPEWSASMEKIRNFLAETAASRVRRPGPLGGP